MNATSGKFSMGFLTPLGYTITNFGNGAANFANQYNLPGCDVNVAQAAPAPDAIASFNFGTNLWVNTFTAASCSQAGILGGGPMSTGMLDDAGGTASFDMSSFFVNWSGVDFNQAIAAESSNQPRC